MEVTNLPEYSIMAGLQNGRYIPTRSLPWQMLKDIIVHVEGYKYRTPVK
jgi:hypothetical protein